jgi:hypothetical protein
MGDSCGRGPPRGGPGWPQDRSPDLFSSLAYSDFSAPRLSGHTTMKGLEAAEAVSWRVGRT